MPMFFVFENNKSGYLRSVFLLFPVQCAYQLIDDLFRTHRAKYQIQAVNGISGISKNNISLFGL